MCAFVITYFGGNLSLAWLSHKRLCKLSYILALCYKSTTHNQVNYVKKQKQVTSHIYFLVWLLCCTWIIIQTKTKIDWFRQKCTIKWCSVFCLNYEVSLPCRDCWFLFCSYKGTNYNNMFCNHIRNGSNHILHECIINSKRHLYSISRSISPFQKFKRNANILKCQVHQLILEFIREYWWPSHMEEPSI